LNALAQLPRLDDEALGPCAGCGRVMLGTGFPLFYRLRVRRCGIDANEVRRHVGLAASIAPGTTGLALAAIMGPGVKPVVIMDEFKDINVCNACADNVTVHDLAMAAMGSEAAE
jgi:hypothetical protein